MNVEKAARELKARHFSFTNSHEWTLERKYPKAWAEFSDSWNRLPADHYMKNGDAYRQRRFCKYAVDASSASLEMAFEALDDFVFYQPAAINSYAGGLRRNFPPVESAIRENRIIREIIQTCVRAILRGHDSPTKKWKIYLHQVRINCSISTTGQPTPEGLHRDGHDFVSMHLMSRVGVVGGTSRICGIDGRSLMTVTLENAMDGFLINDRALLHGVSPVTPSTAAAGHRDMLIIDYNRDE